MDKKIQTELEAAAFRRLVQHLKDHPEVQNIDPEDDYRPGQSDPAGLARLLPEEPAHGPERPGRMVAAPPAGDAAQVLDEIDAAGILATAGNSGSSMGTDVLGRCSRRTPARQSTSSSRRWITSADPMP